MRRKIAKRKRKEAIALGANIIYENRTGERDWAKKERGYLVHANSAIWSITSDGKDELEAYKGLIDCIKYMNEMYKV